MGATPAQRQVESPFLHDHVKHQPQFVFTHARMYMPSIPYLSLPAVAVFRAVNKLGTGTSHEKV